MYQRVFQCGDFDFRQLATHLASQNRKLSLMLKSWEWIWQACLEWEVKIATQAISREVAKWLCAVAAVDAKSNLFARNRKNVQKHANRKKIQADHMSIIVHSLHANIHIHSIHKIHRTMAARQ